MAQMPYKPSIRNSTKTTYSEFDHLLATDWATAKNSSFPSEQQESFDLERDRTRLAQEQQHVVNLSSRAQWWSRLSVKTKATLVAVLIGITPVVAVGAIAYYFVNQSITNQIKQTKRDRAAQLANEINLFMSDRFADIQVLSQVPVFTNPKVYADVPQAEKVALLDRYVQLYGGIYNSIAFFDLNGDAPVQAQGAPVPNHKTRDFFQRVITTGKPTINPPSISRTTGTLSMHLAAPVKDFKTKELRGVVRFQLPVKGLDRVLQEYYKTAGDEYFVIDNSNKYFLASGNPDRIGKLASDHFPSYARLQKAQTSDSVIDVDPDNNSEKLLTYMPLKKLAGLPELNFGVLIASDAKIAFAAQRDLLFTIEIGTAIAALLVAIVAAILANRATRPILDAAEAVEKIGQGKLDTRLQFQGSDEIAVLGANINHMAAQLQESLASLTFDAAQAQLLTIAKGSRVIHPSDLQNIFDQTVAGTRTLLRLERVVIYCFNTSSDSGVVSESVSASLPSALENSVSDTCIPLEIREAYRQGRITVAYDVREAGFNSAHLDLLQHLEVKSSLITPILSGGELAGLLIAHSCSSPRIWQEFEVNLLQQLSQELGLAIYRVELLEQTTNLATEQRQLKEELQTRALQLLQEVDPISQGDLTTRAKVTADEIGTIADSYNATVDSLRQIVLQVQAAAAEVTTSTSKSEMSVQTLAEEALRQAEEIASALEIVRTMTRTAQDVAASAEEAKAAVQQAAQTVEDGDEAMVRAVDGIQAIRSTVAETAEKVKHLGESSQKISAVVELISAFAAQTNMLALNASIEASRAGEEGRGFAVVAGEVRALARQSAEATEEIRKLVASIQAETSEVVEAMEAGTEQVAIGTQLVDETRQSLNKIMAASLQISQLVTSITEATMLQSQASETVSQTMKNVADIADQTAVEANQVSSSFGQLQKVAQALEKSIGRFKLG
ncbi:methyl-accepting chemotaxis protein [Leptolyngbyaceae cyanobacterium JSC-12]|nr:methyl-accepting chemotaxis protein [Leptolyngbyaceae cyanobacterium JSC-12]